MVMILNQALWVYTSKTMIVQYSLDIGQSEYFSCQPNHDNFMIATFSLKKDLVVTSTSGFLRLYAPSKTALPIFERDVPDASEIDLKWSPDGKSLLMVKSSN